MKFPSIIFEDAEEQTKVNAVAPSSQANESAPGDKPKGPLIISRRQGGGDEQTEVAKPALGAQRTRKVFKKATGQEGMISVLDGADAPQGSGFTGVGNEENKISSKTLPPEASSFTKREIRVAIRKGKEQQSHPVTMDPNDPSLVSLKVRVAPGTEDALKNLGDISLVLHAGNGGNSVLAPEGVDVSDNVDYGPIPTVSLHNNNRSHQQHPHVQMVPVMMVPMMRQGGFDSSLLNAVQPLYPYVQANPSQPMFVAPMVMPEASVIIPEAPVRQDVKVTEEVAPIAEEPSENLPLVETHQVPIEDKNSQVDTSSLEIVATGTDETQDAEEIADTVPYVMPVTVTDVLPDAADESVPELVADVKSTETEVHDNVTSNTPIQEEIQNTTTDVIAVSSSENPIAAEELEVSPPIEEEIQHPAIVQERAKAPVFEDIYEFRKATPAAKTPAISDVALAEKTHKNDPVLEKSKNPGDSMENDDVEASVETLPPLLTAPDLIIDESGLDESLKNSAIQEGDLGMPDIPLDETEEEKTIRSDVSNGELDTSAAFVAPVEIEEIPSTIEESDPASINEEPEATEPIVIVMDVAPENTVPKKPSPLTFIEKPVYAKPLSLHQRCFSLDLKGVASFLENGANPIGIGHVIDEDGNSHSGLTPLQAILLATEFGSEEIAPKMLKKQAARIVKLLLSRGALTSEMEKDLAFYCVTKDLPEVMQVLFENNMKLRRHGYDMVGLALQIGHKDILKSLEKFNCPINIKNDRGNRPFLDICSKTLRVDVPKKHRKSTVEELTAHIRSLVDYGLNLESVDYVGSTALVRAVASGNEPMMWALINCGANPRVKFKNGVSLPHLAAACLSPSSFRSFIDQTGTLAELKQLSAKNLQPDIKSMILTAKRT